MAKISFGEYSGYTTPGGVRFMKGGKLVKEDSLPPEVSSYIRRKLEGTPRGEEGVGVREDKIRQNDASGDAEGVAPPETTGKQPTETTEPITEADFDEPTDEQINQMGEELYPVLPLDDNGEPITPKPSPTEVSPDFLEQVSIHTASLEDIAQALHERFGIYTVYLNKLPVSNETNPLTGEVFTKYHQGIAYQAALYARNKGILKRNPELGRKSIDNEAKARQEFKNRTPEQSEDSFAYRTSYDGQRPKPKTFIEHIVQEDGSIRAVRRDVETPPESEGNGAGVRRVNDLFGDEPIVEPKLGGNKIIRPNW